MTTQSPQEQTGGQPSGTHTRHLVYALASSLAVLTEPFVAYRFGKRHFGMNVIFAGVVLMGWIAGFPEHTPILVNFGGLWLAMVVIQSVMAKWSYHFGLRQITTFVGIPLISRILPFGEGFCRRLLTPLLTFGAGYLIPDEALALLIEWSAIGQFVFYAFLNALQVADDEARSDALITMRNR